VKHYFCQLLNVQGAGRVRQTEIHTAEPFVPESSASEFEVGIGKLNRYRSSEVNQIQAGGGEHYILRSIS
jgi:hypothetical protein